MRKQVGIGNAAKNWKFFPLLPSDAGLFSDDWPPPRTEALPVSPPRLTAAVVMRGAVVVMRGDEEQTV